jgi:AmmeMemoRadiSam system protein A
VASSDFVHYGERYAYTPFGPTPGEAGERLRAFDDRAVALVAAGDPGPLRAFFEETGHNACGRQPLLVLLELLRRRAPGAAATLVARYASSDLPFLREATSVGYASLAFTRERADEPVPPLGVLPTLKAATAEDWRVGDELGAGLARLARATLETDYFGGDALARALRDLAEARPLARRQAVFVSLYREGPPGAKAQERLRGCRGQGEPVLPLDLAVVQAALEAATRDERFPRVRAEELGRLQVEVTVLSPLREVDSHEAYRFGQDGLALIQGKKGALFLPQVWREAGWSSEEALQELSRKAGLPHDAWRRARLIAFEGQAFAEERIASGLP